MKFRQLFYNIRAICICLFIFAIPVYAKSYDLKFIASWNVIGLSEAAYVVTKPVKNLMVNICVFTDGEIQIVISGKQNGKWIIEDVFIVKNLKVVNRYLTDQTDFQLQIVDSETSLFGNAEILLGHTSDLIDYISFSLPGYSLFLDANGTDSNNLDNLLKLCRAFNLLNSGQIRSDELYYLF